MVAPILLAAFLVSLALVAPAQGNDYLRKYEEFVEKISHNASYEGILKEQSRWYAKAKKEEGSPFPCTVIPPSPTVPTSVDKLRPGDIKVIAAMGDSLTAALAADAGNILGVFTEYRGLAWSIGGDGTYEDQETIPNILKRYNPNIIGFSVGEGDSEENSRFNVAVSGSVSGDLAEQTRILIDRMKNDPEVDFENDWKMITIMTGGNDICDICFNEDKYSGEHFIENIRNTLDTLIAEVPRAFVNLAETPNIEIAKKLNKGLFCTVMHIACPCASFPLGERGEELVTGAERDYHTLTEQLIASGRYDVKEDFTVVVQPFFRDTLLPRTPEGEPDMTYFAPDCFHLTRKGQATIAISLWNNMMHREGQKSTKWVIGETLTCPTEESPFFYTRNNSEAAFGSVLSEEDDVQTEVQEEEDDTGNKVFSVQTTTLAIGSSFVVLVVIGLMLTALWMLRRRRRDVVGTYKQMNDDKVIWEKPASHMYKRHSP